MQVNIIITELNGRGKKETTTVSYVNPTATNQQLRQLAINLSNFTDNEYVHTTKETKEEL